MRTYPAISKVFISLLKKILYNNQDYIASNLKAKGQSCQSIHVFKFQNVKKKLWNDIGGSWDKCK